MNRLDTLKGNRPFFIGFITGGDPTVALSAEFIDAMLKGGADAVGIGIPFSDPVAEGPVVQDSILRALSNRCTALDIFDLVASVRKKTQAPILLSAYLNTLFCYGYEAFFAKCAECGVDGIFVHDLPYEEHEELSEYVKKSQVELITVVSPSSSERVKLVAENAGHLVSVVTPQAVSTDRLMETVREVRAVSDAAVAIGFGVQTPERAAAAIKFADGVIADSEIVRLCGEHGKNAAAHIETYVRQIVSAIR